MEQEKEKAARKCSFCPWAERVNSGTMFCPFPHCAVKVRNRNREAERIAAWCERMRRRLNAGAKKGS